MKEYEKIKFIILDVDGTLTDGGIYYDSQGNELKHFDVKDGLGIKVAINAGIIFAIITGRESVMVIRRAKELGIQYVKTGTEKKYPVFKDLQRELRLDKDEIGYIGDDWNDLQCMINVGFSACPKDAANEIKKNADYVSEFAGGKGAVRDCLEFLLKKQGKWERCARELYF